GHRIAHIVHPVAAENRDVARRRTAAVGLPWHPALDMQVLQVRDVGPRQDKTNARYLSGGIQRADGKARLGHRRAQHIAVQHAVPAEIVRVAPPARNERVILLAENRRAHAEFRCENRHAEFPRDWMRLYVECGLVLSTLGWV